MLELLHFRESTAHAQALSFKEKRDMAMGDIIDYTFIIYGDI